ncbi:mannosyltransferase family protein [Dactylosporangium sp. CA-092794]|uniref:mannosyltransferase family protein n=1 Tax=Dactylosporangium sp. CA-092794 TaxID=3239929 RepID=UPI003D8D8299
MPWRRTGARVDAPWRRAVRRGRRALTAAKAAPATVSLFARGNGEPRPHPRGTATRVDAPWRRTGRDSRRALTATRAAPATVSTSARSDREPHPHPQPYPYPRPAGTSVDRPWRRALLCGLGVFAASRAGLAAVSVFAWIGDPRPRGGAKAVARLWATQYDSPWFTAIAEHGYQRTADASPAAFFPLYPALIRLCTPLTLGRSWAAALLVANAALLAALIVLFRLAERELGEAAAGRTIFYLVAFPTGFFLSAAYNEGLFIALAAATVYCLRRERWWWAGALGGLAAATRSAGILLLGAFVFEYIRVRRSVVPRWEIVAGLLIPAGLGAVMIVDRFAYGDPLAFSHTQAAHWGRHLAWPWQAPIDAARAPGRPFTEIWTHNVLELATVMFALVLLVLALAGPWRMRRDQLVLPLFGAALLVFMISFPSRYTGDIPYPLYSASRIGLEIFPAFMLLGRLGAKPSLERVVLLVFLTAQGVLAAHFLHSGWVA